MTGHVEVRLAKIKEVSYGMGGYQDVMLGISFNFEGKCWGVNDFWGFWQSEPSDDAKWNKQDQITYHGKTADRIGKLLLQAKVSCVENLIGAPVEITMEDNMLKSWRILEEVI